MRSTLRRLTGRAAIVLTMVITGGIVAASPAQAVECTSPASAQVVGNGAYASVIVSCSGGNAYVSGWLQDSACDGKSAKIRVESWYIGFSGTPYREWSSTTTHSGGCNTGRSYSASGIEATRGYVRACVWAASTLSWTSEKCVQLHY